MSEEKTDLVCKAFVAAQAKFKAAIKDSSNPHFKSHYADLSSVIEAIREALAANDLAFVQPIDWGRDGDGHYVISTHLIHASGQRLALGYMRVPLTPQDTVNAQKVGAAITYARRYHLSAAMGIAQEDDDGNSLSLPLATAGNPRPMPPRPSAGPSRPPAGAGPAQPVDPGHGRDAKWYGGTAPPDTKASEKQIGYIRAIEKEMRVNPGPTPGTSLEARKRIDELLALKVSGTRPSGSKQYGEDIPPPSAMDEIPF